MASPRIDWLPWGDEAFAKAAAGQRPILLRIATSWSEACREMAAETDRDEGVAETVAAQFVAVYVDADRRPDVAGRYNQGGLPTNAFLTPRGDLITGGTVFDTSTFRLLLDRVARSWKERRLEVEEAVAATRRNAEQRRRTRPGEEPPALNTVSAVVDLVMDAFDFRYGGFGGAPKYPHGHAIELLLAEFRRTGETRLRDAAIISLEAMWQGPNPLADPDGGFFRYAENRDWSEPRREKSVEENAQLLLGYLSAFQLTGEERWAEAARSILRYFDAGLLDREGARFVFHESTAGMTGAPVGDSEGIVFVDWAAQLGSACIRAGLVLGDDALLDFALAAVDRVASEARLSPEDPLVGHVVEGGAVRGPALLSDQVAVAMALVDAYEAAGDPHRLSLAGALMDSIHAHFLDGIREAYADVVIDRGAEGYLDLPLFPLLENSVAADTLVRLSHLLGAPSLKARAMGILRAVLTTASEYGFSSAPFALALRRALEDEIVTVFFGAEEASAPALREMARAAHTLYVPYKLVRFLDPARDTGRLRQIREHLDAGPVAVVCRGARCAPPTNDPAAVVNLMAKASALGG